MAASRTACFAMHAVSITDLIRIMMNSAIAFNQSTGKSVSKLTDYHGNTVSIVENGCGLWWLWKVVINCSRRR